MTATGTAVPPPIRGLLTSDDVAARLCVKRWRVQELSRAGDLPTVRIGRTSRYRREAVERWIEENES
jgi:excisionase family DNA binding protein